MKIIPPISIKEENGWIIAKYDNIIFKADDKAGKTIPYMICDVFINYKMVISGRLLPRAAHHPWNEENYLKNNLEIGDPAVTRKLIFMLQKIWDYKK